MSLFKQEANSRHSYNGYHKSADRRKRASGKNRLESSLEPPFSRVCGCLVMVVVSLSLSLSLSLFAHLPVCVCFPLDSLQTARYPTDPIAGRASLAGLPCFNNNMLPGANRHGKKIDQPRQQQRPSVFTWELSRPCALALRCRSSSQKLECNLLVVVIDRRRKKEERDETRKGELCPLSGVLQKKNIILYDFSS